MSKLTIPDLAAHRPRMVGLARHLGLSPSEAEDVTQSCLLAALQRLRAGTEITDPRAYLNTALRHACARASKHMSGPALPEEVDKAADAETHLFLQEVLLALDDLPTDQAALLKRVAQGETSPDALAKELGVPVGTVMSRLARGRAALRRHCGWDPSL